MKKIISVITAFCILYFSSGCSQARKLTINDLRSYNKQSEYVILHTPDRKYIIKQYSFREQSLKGNLNKFKLQRGNYIHVYSTSGINYKLDENSSIPLTLAYSDIEEIKYKRTVFGKTFLLTTGVITGAILISGVVEILTDQPIWLYSSGDD